MNIRRSFLIRVSLSVALCLVIFLFLVLNSLASAPRNFPTGSLFTVQKGQTLNQIADSLKADNYIRSTIALKVITHLILKRGNQAVAGEYFFEKRLSAFALAKRLVTGEFHLEPVRVTIPEGLTKFETATVLARKLPDFDTDQFIGLAREGYLFPDTYFFAPNISAEQVLAVMTENFNERIEPYDHQIKETGYSQEEVINMASIVETEARQTETRRIIAGILWKRFTEHMPLQVDVSFKYINGKTTEELTIHDLEIESPYNTYANVGLPPTPIANPGLDSIIATIEPIKTDYYFFLTDNDGVMRYAKTFEDHKLNKEKYLR